MKNNNYKSLVFTLLFFCFSVSIFAQSKQKQKMNIRELKIEYVVNKINLSTNQEQQFLTIYNQYSDELHEIRKAKRRLKNNQDSEYVIEQRQLLDQKKVSIKGKYKVEFLKVLSAEQLNTLYIAEEEFKQLLLERLRKGNHRK